MSRAQKTLTIVASASTHPFVLPSPWHFERRQLRHDFQEKLSPLLSQKELRSATSSWRNCEDPSDIERDGGPEKEFVQQAIAQLPWGRQTRLLDRIKDRPAGRPE